jgi:hypothetical protein
VSYIHGEHAVIVAVRPVFVVQMTRDEVVDMVAVWNGIVATARSVPVFATMLVTPVIRRTNVRILLAHTHPMFVEMTVVREMQMPVVQIV